MIHKKKNNNNNAGSPRKQIKRKGSNKIQTPKANKQKLNQELVKNFEKCTQTKRKQEKYNL